MAEDNIEDIRKATIQEIKEKVKSHQGYLNPTNDEFQEDAKKLGFTGYEYMFWLKNNKITREYFETLDGRHVPAEEVYKKKKKSNNAGYKISYKDIKKSSQSNTGNVRDINIHIIPPKGGIDSSKAKSPDKSQDQSIVSEDKTKEVLDKKPQELQSPITSPSPYHKESSESSVKAPTITTNINLVATGKNIVPPINIDSVKTTIIPDSDIKKDDNKGIQKEDKSKDDNKDTLDSLKKDIDNIYNQKVEEKVETKITDSKGIKEEDKDTKEDRSINIPKIIIPFIDANKIGISEEKSPKSPEAKIPSVNTVPKEITKSFDPINKLSNVKENKNMADENEVDEEQLDKRLEKILQQRQFRDSVQKAAQSAIETDKNIRDISQEVQGIDNRLGDLGKSVSNMCEGVECIKTDVKKSQDIQESLRNDMSKRFEELAERVQKLETPAFTCAECGENTIKPLSSFCPNCGAKIHKWADDSGNPVPGWRPYWLRINNSNARESK